MRPFYEDYLNWNFTFSFFNQVIHFTSNWIVEFIIFQYNDFYSFRSI